MAKAHDGRPFLERRYLVIATDGRHTTLGGHTEPDQEMLDTAAEGLDSPRTGRMIRALGRALLRAGGYDQPAPDPAPNVGKG